MYSPSLKLWLQPNVFTQIRCVPGTSLCRESAPAPSAFATPTLRCRTTCGGSSRKTDTFLGSLASRMSSMSSRSCAIT